MRANRSLWVAPSAAGSLLWYWLLVLKWGRKAKREAVLQRGLASPAFRLGVLGSRRKADERRQRLAAQGYDETDLARIDMPAGLDIGAINPREIALSITAAIIAARPRAHPA